MNKLLLTFAFSLLMGTAVNAQAITTCGTTISTPGTHYLTGNLSCTGLVGINVAADNVTIDLKGFTFSGSGVGAAVTNSNCAVAPKYLKVTNGTISSWLTGVKLCATNPGPAQLSRASISVLTINGCSIGVSLNNVIGAVISNSTIESNTNTNGPLHAGVYIQYGSLNSVSSNTIRYNSGVGVLIHSGSEHNVYGNTVLNNTASGIQLGQLASMTTIKQNQAFGNPTWDLEDQAQTACGNNVWTLNSYGARNKTCIN